jgi:hypothetical protein
MMRTSVLFVVAAVLSMPNLSLMLEAATLSADQSRHVNAAPCVAPAITYRQKFLDVVALCLNSAATPVHTGAGRSVPVACETNEPAAPASPFLLMSMQC